MANLRAVTLNSDQTHWAKLCPCPSIGQKSFWTGQNYFGLVKIVRSIIVKKSSYILRRPQNFAAFSLILKTGFGLVQNNLRPEIYFIHDHVVPGLLGVLFFCQYLMDHQDRLWAAPQI